MQPCAQKGNSPWDGSAKRQSHSWWSKLNQKILRCSGDCLKLKTSAAPFAGQINNGSTKRVRWIALAVVNQMGPTPNSMERHQVCGIYLGERERERGNEWLCFHLKVNLGILIHSRFVKWLRPITYEACACGWDVLSFLYFSSSRRKRLSFAVTFSSSGSPRCTASSSHEYDSLSLSLQGSTWKWRQKKWKERLVLYAKVIEEPETRGPDLTRLQRGGRMSLCSSEPAGDDFVQSSSFFDFSALGKKNNSPEPGSCSRHCSCETRETGSAAFSWTFDSWWIFFLFVFLAVLKKKTSSTQSSCRFDIMKSAESNQNTEICADGERRAGEGWVGGSVSAGSMSAEIFFFLLSAFLDGNQ